MSGETPPVAKKWYQKKRYLIPAGIFALAVLFGGNDSTQVKSQVQAVTPAQHVYSPSRAPIQPVSYPTNDLSNNNYYKNVNGNQVHSPAYSNSVPSGASARCGDGTYSFSQNHRGTCSHHGGVATWLQ